MARDAGFCDTCEGAGGAGCGGCDFHCGHGTNPDHLVEATILDLEASNSTGVFTYILGGEVTPSTWYNWPDMTTAVHGLATIGVGKLKLWLGEGQNHVYGLVNIAAFLAQCMQETIAYNACDENNWSGQSTVDEVGGFVYSAASSCGQYSQSYQDYQCTAEEDAMAGGKMACDVDNSMEMRAAKEGRWLGEPAGLFCAPRSKVPKTPRWDHTVPCSGAELPIPGDVDLDTYFEYMLSEGSCRDYEGQRAGGWTYDGCPEEGCKGSDAPLFGVPEGRTDVEGCCWWGRGVIQTTGTCNYGKLNYYLGKRAADEGRESLFPEIDFCSNPQIICDMEGPGELRWIAGFFYWLDFVQRYNHPEWNFYDVLKSWVDGGLDLTDTDFIDGTGGLVNRGCHNPPACGTGELHGGESRRDHFLKVLRAMRLK